MSEQDRIENVVRLLGSYWSRTYQDTRGVSDLAKAVVWAVDEISLRLGEALDCRAVDTVPDFSTPRWLPFVRLPGESVAPAYGSAAAGDYRPAGTAYGYGAATAVFAPPWGNPVECPLVFELAGGGGRTWVYGRDYRLSEGELLFDVDPEVTLLWAFEPKLDAGYTTYAFGAIGGVREPASASYGAFVRALLAQAAGDTTVGLRRLVCAAFGVPAAGDTPETVEEAVTTGGRSVVVTDAGAYAATSAAHLPAAGDVIAAGEAVDGSITFRTFRGPQDTPPVEVHLDAGFCLSGPLTFGPGDHISGDPAVVERFGRESAERQERYGVTLSRATQNQPLTQPEYLVREMLRYGVVMTEVFSPTARGSARLAVCRPVMPIHASLLLLLRAAELGASGTGGDGWAPAAPTVAVTPAVDSGPLVGYSRSSVTPFGC